MTRYLISISLLLALGTAFAFPPSFEQTKQQLRQKVYFDQNAGQGGDLYCGCDWVWQGRSGGSIDTQACGYAIRAQPTRAARIEYEHVLPAHSLGHQRQCWQNGGRQNCAANDPVFQDMYVNPFNLVPVMGEVNSDRSNYRFSPILGLINQYGACQFKIDFKSRIAEPPDTAKGKIARIYFFMHDRYALPISTQQERILMAWDKQFPVTPRERLIHERKAKLAGYSNPFVTGEKKWFAGYRSSGQSPTVSHGQLSSTRPTLPVQSTWQTEHSDQALIRGNKNSNVYHLSHCPHYGKISPRNIVEFSSESEALNAGFRKAGNCK
ncbi:MAG: deoxyribonuclease I [Rheinheimera sp.]|nr:deoxyribonuclease I [Rheinheimera sp.]|tara:strand:- start:62350 stop:63318 length:969 start_codon:yes stop_codon:yes gene_type:complete